MRPASSARIHLILNAVQLVSQDPNKTLETAKAFRRFFFEEGQNIAQASVQQTVLGDIGINPNKLTEALSNGTAFARLFRDSELQQVHKIEDNPTYLLNNGRQKL